MTNKFRLKNFDKAYFLLHKEFDFSWYWLLVRNNAVRKQTLYRRMKRASWYEKTREEWKK